MQIERSSADSFSIKTRKIYSALLSKQVFVNAGNVKRTRINQSSGVRHSLIAYSNLCPAAYKTKVSEHWDISILGQLIHVLFSEVPTILIHLGYLVACVTCPGAFYRTCTYLVMDSQQASCESDMTQVAWRIVCTSE